MSKLSNLEQQAVADIKAIYGRLSAEAKAEAAQAVSWAEKHFWPVVIAVFALGVFLGGLCVSALAQ